MLIKYGRTPHNCIDLHINQIEESGLCWFGKIGIAPSIDIIRKTIGDGNIKVLLYCQNEVYLCNCIDIKSEKPEKDYPKYYETYLYGRGIYPKIYFCFDRIEEIEKSDLANCVILSSRNNMFDTVKRSMASFFYVEYADPICEESTIKKKKNVRQVEKTKEKKRIIEKNDCYYRDNGICTNKRCISFQYECIRPSSCTKQKLK